MEQNVIQRNMWNTAGKAGLVLGSISAAYLFLTQWLTMSQIPSFLMVVINMLLWIIKFGSCLWLMFIYMRNFSTDNTDADRSIIFKTGMAMAFLSALVYSAFSFANLVYFYPDYLTEQMDIMMQQLSPILDSNTASQMEKTLHNLPQITFFSNLIYCFVYGTALSSGISRLLSKQDLFTGYKPEDK